MGQMFDTTRDQMANWRWEKRRAFGDDVNHSNPQTSNLGNVNHTGERFSWYGIHDLSAMIDAPSCRQYKPGDFRVISPLNWNQIFNEDDDDENWVDPGVRSVGRSRPGDCTDNDDGEGEEDTQGAEKETGKRKDTKDAKGKWQGNGKGKGKGNRKGMGFVKRTPGADDISHAIASQLQKRMSEADLDIEG